MKGFTAFFALVITLLSFAFIGYAAFVVEYEDPANKVRIIDVSLGFIFGTGLTTVMQYFFGSSLGSKEKSEMLSKEKSEMLSKAPETKS